MKKTYHVSGMTCAGCASTVERAIKNIDGVQTVDVNLQYATATISGQHPIPVDQLKASLASFPYRITETAEDETLRDTREPFWNDKPVWKRASINTLNCLIGCSIGDFGMILYLQAFHPGTSMTTQMILAVIAGLFTSVALETILLKWRERFSWKLALQTAISMSFISMIAMEVVMNTTDFMITGGKAAFENPLYWLALGVALIAGFLAPLPYNYYKLKKYNKACH